MSPTAPNESGSDAVKVVDKPTMAPEESEPMGIQVPVIALATDE
jgi:hypothetical protein